MKFAQARPLAPFATQAANSRGRLVSERASPTRSDFQRDRDRVLHSAAFRRLKHKTQVFVEHEGDHFRTRLTHSLEVAQIARSISRALGLDEDLAETLALAHDLGHTPFGHTGEDALEAQMQKWGGFDHNAQALRIVTRLERRYAAFDGLNLTWETLEGLVKHNGPLRDGAGAPLPRHQAHGIAGAILEFDAVFPLDLASHAGPEAQAAAISDDIAYNAHDIDDGLRAGLFTRADLDGVPFLAALNAEIVEEWPMLDEARAIHELMRRVITRFVEDVISESERRLVALAPENVAAVRAAPSPVIGFSAGMAAADRDIKNFLMPRMYRHPKVMVVREQAAEVVADLFTRFMADPDALPPDWRDGLQTGDGRGEEGRRARRVADYIAGMTDRFALQEHRRLFDHTPPLR